jgi:hypothetical protein
VPSSPAPDDVVGAPVEVFVIGRTLRGTLGERFREFVVARFERMHGAGSAPATSLSRTVELTVVAVARVAALRVDLGIADPAFRAGAAPAPPGGGERNGVRTVSVVAETLPGVRPLAGPPGVDRSRTITVDVTVDVTVGLGGHVSGWPAHPPEVHFEVVPDDVLDATR